MVASIDVFFGYRRSPNGVVVFENHLRPLLRFRFSPNFIFSLLSMASLQCSE